MYLTVRITMTYGEMHLLCHFNLVKVQKRMHTNERMGQNINLFNSIVLLCPIYDEIVVCNLNN